MFRETKELTVAEPKKVGRYHKLAEAIRAGAKLVRKQARMHFIYWNDDGTPDEACAIGAAALSLGIARWPSMMQMGFLQTRLGADGAIIERVVHMNDFVGRTFEEIADWLDSYAD